MIAMLGVLTAFFFEFLIKLPHFPFWMMLGTSPPVCPVLLVPYYLLIRLFSTD